jgi:hypothetical protein
VKPPHALVMDIITKEKAMAMDMPQGQGNSHGKFNLFREINNVKREIKTRSHNTSTQFT